MFLTSKLHCFTLFIHTTKLPNFKNWSLLDCTPPFQRVAPKLTFSPLPPRKCRCFDNLFHIPKLQHLGLRRVIFGSGSANSAKSGGQAGIPKFISISFTITISNLQSKNKIASSGFRAGGENPNARMAAAKTVLAAAKTALAAAKTVFGVSV